MKPKTLLLLTVLLTVSLVAFGCTPDTNESGTPPPSEAPAPTETPEDTESTEEAETDLPATEEDATDTDESIGPLPVEAHWEEEIEYTDHETFIADESEHESEIVFTTTETVHNFSILSLAWQETEGDAIRFDTETLYTLDQLTPERPLLVNLTFLGSIPNYGISYEDADGVTYYLSLSESGRDRSLILSPFETE